jgi:hypothetical protein
MQSRKNLNGAPTDGKEYFNIPSKTIDKPDIKCYIIPPQCNSNLATYMGYDDCIEK